MKKIMRHIFFVIVLAFCISEIKAQELLPDEIKANYLYQFPNFLRWPGDAYIDEIHLGVLNGTPKMMDALKKLSKKKYQNFTKLKVTNFTSVDEIKGIHYLFLNNSQNYLFSQISTKLKGSNTVIVTDNFKNKDLIMINFLPDEKLVDDYGKPIVKFQVNMKTLKEVNVNVIPEMESANPGCELINADALIQEAQDRLNKEREKVKKQQEQILTQQKEINAQQEKIDKQKEEIATQQKNIEKQKKELGILTTRIKAQTKELEEKILILNQKGEEIAIQQKKINDQQLEMDKQIAILDKQRKEIDEGQSKIDAQKFELARQGLVIEAQNNLILIFVGFFIIIFILLFFIIRSYIIKKRDNKTLARQKMEIEEQAEQLESINKELEKLSIVASETSSAVTIMSKNGDFQWINAGYTKLYGYTLQLLINELDENITGASSHPDIVNIINTCVSEKKSVIFESEIRTRSGKMCWSQSTLTPILSSEGDVTKLVLIDSDITRIKEAEAEIRRQTEKILQQSRELELKNVELAKLSIVAAKTDNSVIIADKDGEIEWVNEGFERMLGVTFDTFKANYGTNIIKSSLNPDIIEIIDQGIKEKKSVVYSSRTITKKEKLLWIQTTLTPIFDNDGNLLKLVAIDADITKIKLAEEEIARQKQKITDSILYASRIQTALLPPEEYLNEFLGEHFIMFRPRDIVSGDFYWISQKDNKLFIAVADCTGHGVPGAFMSMLGISFLNEIVNKYEAKDLHPHIVLNILRDNVKKSLRQTGKEGEAKDGMDIAFMVYNTDTKVIEFSGANNPILIISDSVIKQIEPDEMPIGIYYNERESFATESIQLKTGDLFYAFSDGYPDQFGGEKGRKFMLKRFRELIFNHHHETLTVQKQIVEKALDDWKGSRLQLDDILVLGVKVK